MICYFCNIVLSARVFLGPCHFQPGIQSSGTRTWLRPAENRSGRTAPLTFLVKIQAKCPRSGNPFFPRFARTITKVQMEAGDDGGPKKFRLWPPIAHISSLMVKRKMRGGQIGQFRTAKKMGATEPLSADRLSRVRRGKNLNPWKSRWAGRRGPLYPHV